MLRIPVTALVAGLVWPGFQGSVQAQDRASDHDAVMEVVNQGLNQGFDSFQLVRMREGWKVISLADTRRNEGCAR